MRYLNTTNNKLTGIVQNMASSLDKNQKDTCACHSINIRLWGR